jgi:predicted pyridoxine 5'-phosphate oxidase superfamily flavin-nucleotide-binding protein
VDVQIAAALTGTRTARPSPARRSASSGSTWGHAATGLTEVRTAESGALLVDVRQSFGNCPKYIQPREMHPAPPLRRPIESLQRLDADAIGAISSADTFFIVSAARVNEATGGVDVSHRGGSPGFVQVEADTLTVPDFKGNRYFNTLGNLVANPRAALLFVDFEQGDLLHLRGTTRSSGTAPRCGSR